MLGVCAVGLKDRRVGGGSRRSSAINDDVPPSVVDRGWEFYVAPSKCQRRLSLAGARCPSCADLVSGALRLLGDTLLTRRMRKPFAVGMKGGLGLGRLCSQRSGIPHLLIRVFTNGYYKVWHGGGAPCRKATAGIGSFSSPSAAKAGSHWNDPPARLRVLLQTTEGIDAIALLTRLQGTGDQATYRCEGLRRGGVRLLGSAATAGARLLLSNRNEEVELPMMGGRELGPLPWVFVERNTQWEWCGEGSVRSRDALVQVLALDEGRCIAVGKPKYTSNPSPRCCAM
jgi:hypothetical protein